VAVFDPQNHDITKYWLATRFDANGRFSIPVPSASAKLPDVPDTKKFEQGTQNQIDQTMTFVRKNAETIDGTGATIIRAMDVAYCLQHLDDEARLNRRILALREFYASGKTTNYPMSINSLEVDLVDVAGADPMYIKYL
jgi:hypothetical protein